MSISSDPFLSLPWCSGKNTDFGVRENWVQSLSSSLRLSFVLCEIKVLFYLVGSCEGKKLCI